MFQHIPDWPPWNTSTLQELLLVANSTEVIELKLPPRAGQAQHEFVHGRYDMKSRAQDFGLTVEDEMVDIIVWR